MMLPRPFRFLGHAISSGYKLRWWPVRLLWRWRWSVRSTISHHGIEMGTVWAPGFRAFPPGHPGSRYMPGLRGVFAHVLWVGPVGVRFGPSRRVSAWDGDL